MNRNALALAVKDQRYTSESLMTSAFKLEHCKCIGRLKMYGAHIRHGFYWLWASGIFLGMIFLNFHSALSDHPTRTKEKEASNIYYREPGAFATKQAFNQVAICTDIDIMGRLPSSSHQEKRFLMVAWREWHRYGKPRGKLMGFVGVGVRVGGFIPQQNPYLHHG